MSSKKIIGGCKWVIMAIVSIGVLCCMNPVLAKTYPKVKVIMMSGPELEGIKKLAELYEKKTGNTVEVEGLGFGEYHSVLPIKLFAGDKSFDICWIQNTWVPEYGSAGTLEPLNEYIAATPGYEFLDYTPIARTAGEFEGKIYALATDAHPMLLFYREDLISKPPETWDELFEVAKQFSQTTNPDSPTKYAITGDYVTGEVLPQTWLNIGWSMGGDIIDKSGRVVINNEGAIEAGRYFEKLAKIGAVPPNLTQVGWDEMTRQYLDGRAAMIVPGWNAVYGSLKGKGKPLGMALIPGTRQVDGSILRTPYCHTWNLAINASSAHKKAAWQFLKFATSKEGLAYYAKVCVGPAAPPRSSVMSDLEVLSVRPDYPLLLETYKFARYFPKVVRYGKVFEAMDKALAEILNLRKSPEDALNVAAEEIKAALAD